MRLWRLFALGFAERISGKLFHKAKRNQLHNFITSITSSPHNLRVPLALEIRGRKPPFFNRDCGDFKGFSFRRERALRAKTFPASPVRRAHIFPFAGGTRRGNESNPLKSRKSLFAFLRSRDGDAYVSAANARTFKKSPAEPFFLPG